MLFRLLVLFILVGSCQPTPQRDERFMEECDCYVYADEVIKQHRKGYTIEFINKATASGCVRKQLKHTSIIKFLDSLGLESVVVQSKHPENLIHQVKVWSSKFNTERMRLTHVIDRGTTAQVTLSTKYINPKDSIFNNSYRPIIKIHMQKQKSQWVEVKRTKNEYWPWQNPTSW